MARRTRKEGVVVATSQQEGNKPVEILPGHTISQRIRKEEGLGFSEVVSTMNGVHPKLVFPQTQVSYKIISGQATFDFGEGRVVSVKQGGIITIPAGKVYSFEGDFSCFMRCDPGFTPESSILVDDNYEEQTYSKLDRSYKEDIVEYNNEEPKRKMAVLGRTTYSVFKGKATFFIDGEMFVLKEGDVITIPTDKEFAYNGNFAAFARIDSEDALDRVVYRSREEEQGLA